MRLLSEEEVSKKILIMQHFIKSQNKYLSLANQIVRTKVMLRLSSVYPLYPNN
jgi:hypothetical protein